MGVVSPTKPADEELGEKTLRRTLEASPFMAG